MENGLKTFIKEKLNSPAAGLETYLNTMAMYLLAETGWKHPEMMCVSSRVTCEDFKESALRIYT